MLKSLTTDDYTESAYRIEIFAANALISETRSLLTVTFITQFLYVGNFTPVLFYVFR